MSKPARKMKPKKSGNKKSFGEIMATEVGYIKRGEKRLSFDFLGGITVMLITILMIVTLAIMNAVQSLDNEIYAKTTELHNTIANNVAMNINSTFNEEDLSAVENAIKVMIHGKLIKYCVITTPDNSSFYVSTLQNPTVDNERISQEALDENKMMHTSCVVKKSDRYNIYIGFSDDATFMERIQKLAGNFAGVFVICLLLGIFIATGLCRRVLKPIGALIKVTGAFSNGDLSDRLEKTKYIEFNELVDSYNGMADSMQRLYSSLEHKVNERTQQLNEAIKELQNTQAMMVHSEKMKSLGELVAGIMHEINNPINFIYGNMTHLKNYSEDLIMLIDKFAEYTELLPEDKKQEYQKLLKEIDYEFLKEDLPDLIKSCHEGTERTKNIILNLKDFSRMEESAITNVDLPKEIDSTLNILNNKFKNKITVHKDYHEDVPKIEAYGGQLNQVFMNILDNAAFAVSDKDHGDVWITIRKDNKFAYVEIEDNGKGMSDETKNKIFNPFFTTKPVGQGTGLGLSISYKVIKNHNGNIDVQSELGKGTKFIIKLPLIFEREEEKPAEKKDDVIEVI